MARATGSATIRNPYSFSSSPAGISQNAQALPPQTESYGGRFSQLKGTKAEIKAKLEAEIARLGALKRKFKEKGTSGVAGRANRKRVREYSDRIKVIRSYAANINREALTSTSKRARVYMAVKGTKDYDKAKRVAAYSYQERAKRSDRLTEERSISRAGARAGLDTDTLTRRSYAKVREEYYSGRLRPSGTAAPTLRPTVTPLSETQAAFYERKRQEAIGEQLTTRHQQFEVLNQQGYTAKDVFATFKPSVTPVLSPGESSGLLPSTPSPPQAQESRISMDSKRNPVKAMIENFRLGSQSTFARPRADDPYYGTDQGSSTPISYRAGQVGGHFVKPALLTAAAFGVPQALRTVAPVAAPVAVPVLSNPFTGAVATIATGIGVYHATTAATDTIVLRGSNEQERALFEKYGKGVIAESSPKNNWLPTYGLKDRPLDQARALQYGQNQGLSLGESRALLDVSNRVFKQRAWGEVGALATASTVTEISGTLSAGKHFLRNQALYQRAVPAAQSIARQVAKNSAILGVAEGVTFTYTHDKARGIPITAARLATGGVAGGVFAGAAGYGIAYKGLTSPKTAKGVMSALYIADPGEAVGDYASSYILSKVPGIKLPAAGIAPGGAPVFVSSFSNQFRAPTTTASSNAQSYTEVFNKAAPPSPRPQTGRTTGALKPRITPDLPSFGLSGGGGARVSVPSASTPSTGGRRPSISRGVLPALIPGVMPVPVPAPTPAPVPSFTPAPVPTFTPTTTPTTTPSTALVTTFTPTPSLVPTPSTTPTPEPTFTFTPVPTITPRFPLPFFPAGLGRGRGKAFVSRKKSRYSPDLPSIDLGIYGKPTIPKRGFTGLEARPIPLLEPKKKRRSKSTKKKKRKTKRKKKK